MWPDAVSTAPEHQRTKRGCGEHPDGGILHGRDLVAYGRAAHSIRSARATAVRALRPRPWYPALSNVGNWLRLRSTRRAYAALWGRLRGHRLGPPADRRRSPERGGRRSDGRRFHGRLVHRNVGRRLRLPSARAHHSAAELRGQDCGEPDPRRHCAFGRTVAVDARWNSAVSYTHLRAHET